MRVEKNKEYSFDKDQFLFKYVDIHKLIYFLFTEKLFFSPLSYFDDPLEGIDGEILYDQPETNDSADDTESNTINTIKQHYGHHLQKIQKKLFASCWFLGTRESLAMWETYSNNDSVAIRFDPNHLCNVMIERFKQVEDEDFSLMVHGKVDYFKLSPFDPNDVSIKNCGHRFTGFLKDLSYKHEEEFRFLLMQKKHSRNYEFFEFSPGNLQDLDFTIITHPYMEGWKYNNILTLLQSKGLEERLRKSDIPTKSQIFEWG